MLGFWFESRYVVDIFGLSLKPWTSIFSLVMLTRLSYQKLESLTSEITQHLGCLTGNEQAKQQKKMRSNVSIKN